MIYSILLICPYFGKLPEFQFPLWLKSCKYNPTIDWLIITDDKTSYEYPSNVKVLYTDWNSFRNRVQSVFDFPISLDKPFKVCDFRPAFGEIFGKELSSYDFWGHTDCSDTIYGDLRAFLTEEKLKEAEKVMFLGHFTLYRNKKEINNRYKLQIKTSLTYKDILSSENSMVFDGFAPHCINRIFKEYGFPITDISNFCFDITHRTPNFTQHIFSDDWSYYYDPEGCGYCLLWKDGKLFTLRRQGLRIKKREVGYAHFQKRKMTGKVKGTSFLIVPNKFVTAPLCFNVFHFIYYSYLPFRKNRISII